MKVKTLEVMWEVEGTPEECMEMLPALRHCPPMHHSEDEPGKPHGRGHARKGKCRTAGAPGQD